MVLGLRPVALNPARLDSPKRVDPKPGQRQNLQAHGVQIHLDIRYPNESNQAAALHCAPIGRERMSSISNAPKRGQELHQHVLRSRSPQLLPSPTAVVPTPRVAIPITKLVSATATKAVSRPGECWRS